MDCIPLERVEVHLSTRIKEELIIRMIMDRFMSEEEGEEVAEATATTTIDMPIITIM